jgi:Tol biopolymer transport system component
MSLEMGNMKPVIKLHLMKRDGSEERTLPAPEELSAAMGRFSPDGKRVLFLGINPEVKPGKPMESALFVVDVADGKPKQITDVLNAEFMGYTWSPDGKRVAYIWRQRHEKPEADQETESFLIVSDADGKNAKTIVTEKAKGQGIITLTSPDWR